MTSPGMSSPRWPGRAPDDAGDGRNAPGEPPVPSDAPASPTPPLPTPDALSRALTEASQPAPGRATFLRSFVYAWQGLTYAFRTQRNARVHLVLAILALAVGIALRIAPVEMAIVFVAIVFVFITEMLNTVAEAIVDMVTHEYHPLARIAKDVAAGAVLLSALLAVVIGILIFGPHLWALGVRVWGW